MRTIAIITARANSKGVPKKNLRLVGGVSLLGRSVQAAVEANIFDEILVTTDGEEIAEEARQYGARVVCRPFEIAGSTAKSIDAVCHAIDAIGASEGICVLLQPTSPLRTASDIIAAVDQFKSQSKGSVIAVCECEHHPYKSLSIEDGIAVPFGELASLEAPRQSLPKMFRPNGAIYVNTIADLREHMSFFVPPVGIYEMPSIRSIDIDSELDLVFANSLIGDSKHDSSF